MAETAKRATRAKVEAVPEMDAVPDPAEAAPGTGEAVSDDAVHEPSTCPVAWCPICLAVTAVQPVKPDVVEHLLKAGTEFFLALRALIDARGDDLTSRDDDDDGGTGGSFHKIEIG